MLYLQLGSLSVEVNMERVKYEFESWAKMQGLRLERQTSMCGGDMGRYDFGPTQAAFEVWVDAWQMSRAVIGSNLPKVP